MKKLKRRLISIVLTAVMIVSSVLAGNVGMGGVVEVKAGTITAPTEPQEHVFDYDYLNNSKKAKDDDFYTFNPDKKNMSAGGAITYQGTEYTYSLKWESVTYVKFTTSVAGTLTLVFNSKVISNAIKCDGIEYSSTECTGEGNSGAFVVNIDIESDGTEVEHALTQGTGGQSLLYYMVFTPSVPKCETHTWGEWETTVAPTCQTAGEQKHKCTVCGTEETEVIEASDEYHVWDEEFTTDVYPTTEAVGSKSRHCTMDGCDAKTDVQEIPKLDADHICEYTSEVTKEATCIEEGEKKFTCECGDTYTEPIAMKEHTYSEEWTVDVEATTSSVGSESRHCTMEGCTATTDVREIPKVEIVPHIYDVTNDTTDAFFTVLGDKGGDQGSVVYNNETLDKAMKVNGTLNIKFTTDVKSVITLVVGQRNDKDYTFDQFGMSIVTNGTANDETYEVVDFEYEDGTTGQYGILTYKVEAGVDVEIKKTATTKEYRLYYVSVICDHQYSTEVIKAATCIAEGEASHTCSVCEDTYTEVLEMTEHNYSEEWTTDIEAGDYTAGSKSRHCTTEGCDAKTDITPIDPNLGACEHDYVGETTKAATCLEEGEKTYTCSKCSAFYTEVIEITDHVYAEEWTEDIPATILTAGSESRHCTTEGCTATTDVREIAAIGVTETKVHNFTESGLTSDFFTFVKATEVSTDKPLTYAGTEYTSSLYTSESGMGFDFVTDRPGTLIILSDIAKGKKIKFNGTNQEATDDSGIMEYAVTAAGTVSVVRNSSINIYWIEFVPEGCERVLHKHSYTGEETTAPTCADKGVMTYTCTCGESYEEDIEATGEHTFENYVSDDNATCTEDGTKTAKCENCNATETVADEGSAKGHVWSEEWTTDVEPTETTPGTKSRHCTFEGCDAKTDVTPIDPVGSVCEHNYEGVETKKATCLEDGEMTYTCSKCGVGYTVTIEKVPHSYSEDYTEDVAATILTAGSESRHCTTEGCTATTDVREIPAIGVPNTQVHNFTEKELTSGFFRFEGVTATSEEKKVTYGGVEYTKSVYLTSDVSISFDTDRAGTLLILTNLAEGKIFKVNGSKDYKTDSNGILEAPVTKAGTVTITKENTGYIFWIEFVPEGCERVLHKHSYTGSETTAPTCVDKGVKTFTCTCGVSYTEDIAATGVHTYGEYVSDENATCTEDGTKTAKCENCDVTDTVADEGSAKGHTWSEEWTTDVEPTETTAGSKSRHCTAEGCDAKTDVTVIEPKDDGECEHNYEPSVTKEATCDKAGEMTYTCSKCSKSYTVVIEATGHSYGEYVSDDNATCTEDGTKTAKCENCDATDTVADKGSAKGHTWSEEWTTDVEPTETTPGSKSHHCTVEGCDAKTDETEIPATGKEEIKYGDTDGNGEVDIADGVVLKKYLAGIREDNADVSAFDVNADGDVNVADAVLLLKYLAGYTDIVLGAPSQA